MSIAPGYTDDEVRDFVHEYERQPYGTKAAWLRDRGVKLDRLYRWRDAVYDGDLDRGLVPRDGSGMSSPNRRRRVAKHRARQEKDNEQLRARIHELEQTNEALGKAIGLLHQLNEQEPDTPATTEQKSSSPPKTS